MAGFLETLLVDYRAQLDRYRNRPLLRASMAACALAATADGEVSLSERMRVDKILETLEALRIFDPHEGVELFNYYTEEILAAPHAGRDRALRAVRTVTDDPETAALVIRICLAVAEAKSEKHLADQIQIVMLCSLLGVEPESAGLYIDQGEPKQGLGLDDEQSR